MDCLDEIVESTYKECFEDYVGLWFVIARVERVCKTNDPIVRRNQAMVVIEELLKHPDIGVGQFDDGKTFTFWNLSTNESLAKINSEWDAIDHEPSLGDIAWLTSR